MEKQIESLKLQIRVLELQLEVEKEINKRGYVQPHYIPRYETPQTAPPTISETPLTVPGNFTLYGKINNK